jgi:hypothetical protein
MSLPELRTSCQFASRRPQQQSSCPNLVKKSGGGDYSRLSWCIGFIIIINNVIIKLKLLFMNASEVD